MMSKLEEIIYYFNGYGSPHDDLIIKMAKEYPKLQKRVEELEEENYQDPRQEVLEGLYEQNQRYKQALEFYADNMTYNSTIDKESGGWEITDISKDRGKKARQALKGESE